MNEVSASAEVRIEAYQEVRIRRDEIDIGLNRLKQARAAVKDWDRRLQESARLSDRRHELDVALNAARAALEADLREVETRINLLEPKIAAADTQRKQLDEAQAKLGVLRELEKDLKADQDSLAVLGQEVARLDEHNRRLKEEMDDIKTNLTRLEAAGSNCPICQRPLDEAHRAEVAAQFQAEGTTKGDVYRANRARLGENETEQQELTSRIGQAESKLAEMSGVQRTVAQLEQSLGESTAARADIEVARNRWAELQKSLESQDFAGEVLADLSEVEAELATLGYEKEAHNRARAEVDELSAFEEEGRALTEADKKIKEEQARLEKEQARRTRLRAQSEVDRDRIVELEADTAGLAELNARLNEASSAVDDWQRQESFARDKVARAQQMLDHVVYLAKERSKQADKLQQTRETLGIYRELQLAFGKKGVQALLIESAIPEIEDEANGLLNRMTDGRMNVRFETQREAKSSDTTIETLDIRIADEMGTRDYELYSGGEAFRVNFAIRVAISKVLARRAGARLQTLVLDEGFGTQDVQGRERLVEAINTIQADFEKIIVITHIDELKDAFPARIDVWKTAEGSNLAVR
jgi:exonuclease SbcC